jgi:hypothetical protein
VAGDESRPRWVRFPCATATKHLRALTLAEARLEFRAQLVGDNSAPPSAAALGNPPFVAAPATLDGVTISFREIELLQHAYQKAVNIIQGVRHTVRAGKPVTTEPPDAKFIHAAAAVLQAC